MFYSKTVYSIDGLVKGFCTVLSPNTKYVIHIYLIIPAMICLLVLALFAFATYTVDP